jgi:hypothetical protein
METNPTKNNNSTVTPAHRFNAHRVTKQLRAEKQYDTAHIIQTAIAWESFPQNFTPMQAELGAELLLAEYGTENWYNIATTIQITLDNK